MIVGAGVDYKCHVKQEPDFAISDDGPRAAAAPGRNRFIALTQDLGSESLHRWMSAAYER
jgi:hypothetical protein